MVLIFLQHNDLVDLQFSNIMRIYICNLYVLLVFQHLFICNINLNFKFLLFVIAMMQVDFIISKTLFLFYLFEIRLHVVLFAVSMSHELYDFKSPGTQES